jgi:hypothetical protein
MDNPLLREIEIILDGIDRDELDTPPGWWESGAEFGSERLQKVREAFARYDCSLKKGNKS